MKEFNFWEWKKSEAAFVIGICLLVLGISKYQITIGAMKTRDSQRMQDVSLISRAIRTYYDDYKVYPMEATGEGKLLSCGEKGKQACEWGNSTLVDRFNVVYLNKIPGDPEGSMGKHYVYKPDKDLQHFRLYVALEYSGTTKLRPNLTTECGIHVQCNWYEEN